MLHLGSCRSKRHALLSGAVVTSRPGLQLRAVSGSGVPLQPGSALVPMAPVAMRAMRVAGILVLLGVQRPCYRWSYADLDGL